MFTSVYQQPKEEQYNEYTKRRSSPSILIEYLIL